MKGAYAVNRLVLAIMATTLVVASCTTRSDRTTDLPVVPSSLVPNAPGDVGLGRCSFAFGEGNGAVVSEIVPGGPADGNLLPGDLVIEFGGTGINTASDLVDAVRASEIGGTVSVDGVRDGEPFSIPVAIGESTQVSGRPILGVIVTTLEEMATPEDLADATRPDGPLVRVASIDDQLWLLDPTGVSWSPLGVSAPLGAFTAIAGEVYVIESDQVGQTLLRGSLERSNVIARLGIWQPVTVLATLDRYILIGAAEIDADGTILNRSIVAIDPVTGTARWAWVPDADSPATVPSFGFRSPSGALAVVALAADDSSSPERYVLLWEEEGGPMSGVPIGIPEDSVVLGWHDDFHLIAVVETIGDVALVDPFTGSSTRSTLPLTEVPLGLWPVGDGEHILVEDGSGLQLIVVGGIARRQLTRACGEASLAEIGWSFG